MSHAANGRPAEVFTVGHSNHTTEHFLGLLTGAGVEVLVDTRSSPYSRYAAQFNRENLQADLRAAGVKYLFLGRELGGRPEGDEYYDADGHVLYAHRAGSAEFRAGIERVERGLRQYRVALLCSEEDPAVCHRYRLVGRVLAGRGVTVRHIRGDGRVQGDEDVKTDRDRQGSLFALPEEETWKSLRSVSPRKPRPSSSDSSDEPESDD